jgi:hypothetical protein
MSARIFYDRVRPPHHASKVFKLVAHDKATVMVMPGDYGTIQKMARQGYFFDIDMIDGLEQAVYASRIRGQSHFEDWTYSGTHVAFMIYGYDSGFYFSTDPNIEYIPSSTLLADWGIDA